MRWRKSGIPFEAGGTRRSTKGGRPGRADYQLGGGRRRGLFVVLSGGASGPVWEGSSRIKEAVTKENGYPFKTGLKGRVCYARKKRRKESFLPGGGVYIRGGGVMEAARRMGGKRRTSEEGVRSRREGTSLVREGTERDGGDKIWPRGSD